MQISGIRALLESAAAKARNTVEGSFTMFRLYDVHRILESYV
jgi:hypothetical protein